LLLSVLINLGCLCYFKYANFFIQNWTGIIKAEQSPVVMDIILPIGISFFVFKSLSYIIDIYRGKFQQPERNYFNYLLYVAFFPNIMAGPISLARDLLPQIKNKLFITNEYIGKGFFLIMTGAFKKVFIADLIAVNFVDRVFQSPEYFSGFENLVAGYGATIQIYADFSGYTDIVIGISFLLGFAIKTNFNKPFLAVNVTDFWKRWHITLSEWFREYLFLPLAYWLSKRLPKNRYMGIRTEYLIFINAGLITFFVSGFWHGPNWTFILWGLSHGVAISWDVLTTRLRKRIRKKVNSYIYNFFSILITFHFLCLSFILFKSADIKTAGIMYSKIFNSLDLGLAKDWILLYTLPFIIIIIGYILHYLPMGWNNYLIGRYIKLNWLFKSLIFVFALLFIYQAFSSEAMPFVYLEF
jgi:alginate O-acetyltransferase complex protein AlgI